MDQDTLNRIRVAVQETRSRLRVTKIVATRAVKTSRGDFFCGMSAAWDSVQNDSGGAADLGLVLGTDDEMASGMSIEEARVSHLLLSLEAGIGAWRAALSEGAITPNQFEERVRDLKRNTVAHLERILPPVDTDTDK